MRRAFWDLVRPCARTDADLSAVAQRLALEEKAEQRRYDTETNHGLLADHQAAWSRDVTRRLGGSQAPLARHGKRLCPVLCTAPPRGATPRLLRLAPPAT